MRPVADLRRGLGDWLFNLRPYALARRREHVLCVGDSHIRVMWYLTMPGVWFRTLPVEGATASGILNPNGATGSMATIGDRLVRARRWQRVMIQLGEIDCGFLIWHRAKRHALSIDEQLNMTLETYARFLTGIAQMGFREIIVLSVPAPTITDDPINWGDVANLRSGVTATQRERTDLTIRFNKLLGERCGRMLGVTFLDITSHHLDPATGLVAPEFLRATPGDHHLADGPYGALIVRELARHWA